ncbi:hypothetical protein PCE1_000895 [Barthelona sp. PCE]
MNSPTRRSAKKSNRRRKRKLDNEFDSIRREADAISRKKNDLLNKINQYASKQTFADISSNIASPKFASPNYKKVDQEIKAIKLEGEIKRAQALKRLQNNLSEESQMRQNIHRENFLSNLEEKHDKILQEQEKEKEHIKEQIYSKKDELEKIEKDVKVRVDNVKSNLRSKFIDETQDFVEEKVHEMTERGVAEAQRIEQEKSRIRQDLGLNEPVLYSLGNLKQQEFTNEGRQEFHDFSKQLRKDIKDQEQAETAPEEVEEEPEAEMIIEGEAASMMVQRIDDLELRLLEKNKEIETLEEDLRLEQIKCEALTSDVTDLTAENEGKDAIVVRMTDEHRKLLIELQTIENEKLNLEQEINNIEMINEERQQRRIIVEKKQRKELRLLRAEIGKREQEIQKRSDEITDLKRTREQMGNDISNLDKRLDHEREFREVLKKRLQNQFQQELRTRMDCTRCIHWLVVESVKRAQYMPAVVVEQPKEDEIEDIDDVDEYVVKPVTFSDLSDDDLSFMLDDSRSEISDAELDELHTSALEDGLSELDSDLLDDEVLSGPEEAYEKLIEREIREIEKKREDDERLKAVEVDEEAKVDVFDEEAGVEPEEVDLDAML